MLVVFSWTDAVVNVDFFLQTTLCFLEVVLGRSRTKGATLKSSIMEVTTNAWRMSCIIIHTVGYWKNCDPQYRMCASSVAETIDLLIYQCVSHSWLRSGQMLTSVIAHRTKVATVKAISLANLGKSSLAKLAHVGILSVMLGIAQIISHTHTPNLIIQVAR